MAEPELVREGNARIATLPTQGIPAEPWRIRDDVVQLLSGQGDADPFPGTIVLIDLPPTDDDPRAWRCQVGCSLLGRPEPLPPLLIEDYRQLHALSLPHMGPVSGLRATWAKLQDHAKAHGWMLRPYWRISVIDDATSDGHPLPECTVSVFIDR